MRWGLQKISKLDLNFRHYQIHMREYDIPKTAFRIPKGNDKLGWEQGRVTNCLTGMALEYAWGI